MISTIDAHRSWCLFQLAEDSKCIYYVRSKDAPRIEAMPIKASIEIKQTPEQVFRLYQDAARWIDWDPEVTAARLPGGLKLGARGWLKPKRGPKANIEIVEVTPGRSFSVQSRLPLCRMLFGHSLASSSESGSTVATHWVEFKGPLSFLFRPLIGRSIQASLPNTMRGLKRASESQVTGS